MPRRLTREEMIRKSSAPSFAPFNLLEIRRKTTAVEARIARTMFAARILGPLLASKSIPSAVKDMLLLCCALGKIDLGDQISSAAVEATRVPGEMRPVSD